MMHDEIEALMELIPALLRCIPNSCGCPSIGTPVSVSSCEYFNDRVYPRTLEDLIVHLNDNHLWPRVDSDWKLDGEGPALPSISWWVGKLAQKYGWDLNCAVP